MNITAKQEKEATDVLKQLVKMSKDMLPDVSIVLWDNSSGDSGCSSYTWKKIMLSRHGLRLESGFYDRIFDKDYRDREDETYKPRELKPTAKVVREYGLTSTSLKKHLEQFK